MILCWCLYLNEHFQTWMFAQMRQTLQTFATNTRKSTFVRIDSDQFSDIFKMLNFGNKLWFQSFDNLFISRFLNTFRNKFSFKAGFIGRDCAGVGLTTVSRPTRYWYLNFCVNRLYFYISHPDKRMKQKLIWIEYQKLKITATCICLENCFMR